MFGLVQWSIFMALLILMVVLMTLMSIFYKKNQDMAEQSLVYTLLESTEKVYLYVLQLGSHQHFKNCGIKLLALTTTFFTLVMFIFYTTDITAKMTSGPSEVPIRSFKDVIEHGYKVVVRSNYYKSLLANAKSDTAKHSVFKKYLENQDNSHWKDAMIQVISEPKTLMYSSELSALIPRDPAYKYLTDQVVVLRVDASDFIIVGFGLQKDSEFTAMLNYYILKGMENGILDRLFKYYHRDMYTKEQFGMTEPQPLSYGNVIFLFICLGSGVIASFIIAGAELIILKRDKMILRMCKASKTFNSSYKRIKGYCK